MYQDEQLETKIRDGIAVLQSALDPAKTFEGLPAAELTNYRKLKDTPPQGYRSKLKGRALTDYQWEFGAECRSRVDELAAAIGLRNLTWRESLDPRTQPLEYRSVLTAPHSAEWAKSLAELQAHLNILLKFQSVQGLSLADIVDDGAWHNALGEAYSMLTWLAHNLKLARCWVNFRDVDIPAEVAEWPIVATLVAMRKYDKLQAARAWHKNYPKALTWTA